MATPIPTTLLDLVRMVSALSSNESDVVKAVAFLVNSGTFVLRGNFAGSKIHLD